MPGADRALKPPGNPYSPWQEADELGLSIRYAPLTDTYSWWVPSHRLILVADRLTSAQERCALAHEVQHAVNADTECRPGLPASATWARRQEIRADVAAARKLIHAVDLEDTLRWATSREEAASELDVTVYMLNVRLHLREREQQFRPSF
nr:ImmA/IrrE family metallo-endopeptidase [Streptomyces boncukensis]